MLIGHFFSVKFDESLRFGNLFQVLSDKDVEASESNTFTQLTLLYDIHHHDRKRNPWFESKNISPQNSTNKLTILMETLKTMDNIRVGMQTLEVQNAS